MSTIQQLKYLAILTAVDLAAFGAGLNVVPALPEPASGTPGSKDAGEDEFWFSSWNTPAVHMWKGFSLRSTLDYKAFYTDNPLAQAGSRSDDFMHYVSPLIGVSRAFETEQRTTLVSVAYQPTFVVSSLGNGGDRTYQLVRGDLNHLWNEKSVYLSHQYHQSSESSTQSAFLTPQESNQTVAGFRAPLTGKMSASFGVEQTLIDSEIAKTAATQELKNWVANAHVDYQLRAKLQTGVRFSMGYSEQTGGGLDSKFTTERLLSTWNYQISGKLNFNLEAGGQVVQSQVSTIEDPKTTPIVTGRVIYEPRYGTSISAGGGRGAGASQFFAANFLTESAVDFSIRQRIYEDFSVSGRISYSLGDYQQLNPAAGKINRDYSSYNYSTDVQWRINARLTAGLFYQYLSRVSDLTSESFSANQVGLNLSLNL